jgi:glycosyltransferase involved in cell wall biosynthesis
VPETKRLLVLTRDRNGAPFRQRIEPYLPLLAARGIQAEVVELAAGALARRREFRRARGFDGVLLHRKTLTAWDALALGEAGPLLYDFDDAVMFQARSPEAPHPARERRFQRTVARSELVIAGSPNLATHAAVGGAARIEVVPTGLDAGAFPVKEGDGSQERVRLVWIGSASTLRQLATLAPVLEAVGRDVQGAVVRVIADARLDIRGLEIENVPWSLEDEARLLAEADIGIAPLPDTPYTRGKCGFKVLQYMAAGLPVVASPVGINAEYVRPEETGLHATTAEEWTGAVERLAVDPALRERLGRAGRRRVEQEFDFAVLGPKVCGVIEQALA